MSTSYPTQSPSYLNRSPARASIPLHESQQPQQQRSHPSRHELQPGRSPGPNHASDRTDPQHVIESIHTLLSVHRIQDLAVHGALAFLSFYAVSSIISTMNFQLQHGYTSLTALFLFFVTGVSSIVAVAYLILAGWLRTAGAMTRISAYLQEVHTTDEEVAKQICSSRRAKISRRLIQGSLFVIYPRPRLWISFGLMGSSLFAASLQWYKIRNGSNCDALPPMYQHFCRTTKASVVTTYLVAVLWMAWCGWWAYKTQPYQGVLAIVLRRQQTLDTRNGPRGQGNDITISMPEVPTTESPMEINPRVQERPEREEKQHSHYAGPNQRAQKKADLTLTVPELGERGADSNGSMSNVSGSSSLGLGIDICNSNILDGSLYLCSSPDKECHNDDSANGGIETSNSNSGMGRDSNYSEIQEASVNSRSDNPRTRPDQVDAAAKQQSGRFVVERSQSGHDATTPSSRDDMRNAAHAASTRNRSNSDFDAVAGRSSIISSNTANTTPSIGIANDQGESGVAPVERSRSERLRDHAKIFRPARSTSAVIHEAYSNRGTPVLQSSGGSMREMSGFPHSPSPSMMLLMKNNSATPYSPSIHQPMTPTTPVISRGGMGYMGKETMKALNTLPRSTSVGVMGASNGVSAYGSKTPSVQASPMVVSTPGVDFTVAETPCSLRSHRSMSSFLGPGLQSAAAGGVGMPYYQQSQAEAFAAEQSMDEHLRALRRRSYVAEVMQSSAAASIASIDPMSIEDPVSATIAANVFSPGSPAASIGAGSFRMSFSSPNLANLRKRSSLGLKSVLSSIVSTPVASSVASSFSSSTSSESSASSSPRSPDWIHDGRTGNNGVPSPTDSSSSNTREISAPSSTALRRQDRQQQQQQQQQMVSAQELLRAEYGDLIPPRPHYSNEPSIVHSPQQSTKFEMCSSPGTHLPSEAMFTATSPHVMSFSRLRSASMSSANTTHSTMTSRTSSSVSSDSNASTVSTMTSLSNEEKKPYKMSMLSESFSSRAFSPSSVAKGIKSGNSNSSSRSSSSSSSNSSSNSKRSKGQFRGGSPTSSFINRILIGTQHHLHQQQHQQPQSQGQQEQQQGSKGKGVGPSRGSGGFRSKKISGGTKAVNSVPAPTKQFPVYGDLSQYAWDYRKEMPAD
ncbi:hypothetical protein EC968_010367 [Mortierella alpina]|nr:hypothetical protein EC968_010367 [Mortierella alpina]